VVGYQRFKGPCYLHLQGEVTGMGQNNPDDLNLKHHRRKSLRTPKEKISFYKSRY